MILSRCVRIRRTGEPCHCKYDKVQVMVLGASVTHDEHVRGTNPRWPQVGVRYTMIQVTDRLTKGDKLT